MHFHLLPRKAHGDRFAASNDEVYPALERAENELPEILASVTPQHTLNSQLAEKHGVVENAEPLRVDADEDRKPRTLEEMVQEAEWLKTFFEEGGETQSSN